MRITDLLIQKLKPELGEAKQKTYFDDTLKGFGVRLSVGGTKSFVIVLGKTRSTHTLGRYPDMSLAEARKRAKQVQGEKVGLSPAKIASLSFADAREQFLADTKPRTKSSTYDEYKRLLNKHFPFQKPLGAITRRDIMEAVTTLRDQPSVEQHCFVAIRTMMNWCLLHGLLTASPVPPLRFKTESRTRVLTDDELKTVWGRAIETGYPYGTLVQLLILTGQRRGEIAGLRRVWIKDEWITFPVGFTKNKREHRIPYCEMTKAIIERVKGKTDLLFPARGHIDVPFSGWSKAKREFDEGLNFSDYTLHDLRRTFSSNLAKIGVPIHVTEKILNHVSGTVSGVAAVYNRHSYADEMQEAKVAHEKYLANLVAQPI